MVGVGYRLEWERENGSITDCRTGCGVGLCNAALPALEYEEAI